MKVYTKTGDTGTTALFGGTRVPKHHIRIESYGTVDELNSHIGLIRDQEMNQLYKNVLIEVQDRLFTVGAILATPPEKETLKNGQKRLQNLGIQESDIEYLENQIDAMEESLPQMTHFVLPGGHTTVSYCHIARCVCRRAERLAVHLNDIEPTDELVIKYLNRLSDYLFVLARKLSFDLNADEVQWIPRK
ncbi:cob(I)yrinic acid a,c-diamide adenosyltransferase [Flavobacterium aquatile]|uniref:Corrinoid adenosyltransferase n=1 Tax=Flavobacterium aquatile LMG 4008 = ATCC 11947 TaxID=1453498 RepID=A0A095V0Q6_9FLAO|nr:cob(I)yrinic acid a,c-diamide adenosyltransferase [Flavobacterium aquatile]KGD68440.1 cob(I)yrinic acid a c-diamide adenosyltransferase [Flavobacterium aquatile LMG 4008 = ATCC 11947]OXA68631.1 ATP:cob(I)alamin adenosyltransferase [Flavobacterium aquatile LMG 4008 = ATCC 11947]GEC79256.1 cobalamin adenosyltransferase [Flavobacterium aquatile]